MRNIVRYVFLLLVLGFCGSPAGAAPQEVPATVPYKTVGPFKEDASRVIVFFAFDCDHCRETFPAITKWGATLPTNIKFELMPVTTAEPQYTIPSRAWYAATATGATTPKMRQFAEEVMDLVQVNGMSITSPDVWRKAVVYAGIKNFETAWKSVPPATLERAIKKLSDYQVTSTPAVVIDGRYVITPDNTNGDLGLFLQLASGLLSSAIAH